MDTYPCYNHNTAEAKEKMNQEQFMERYGKHLNSQQVKAVQTVEGPVLLLAVPGSGKTTVLVTRLGYMIKCKGISPDRLLVLTYTVAATADMKSRFYEIFSDENIQRVPEFRTINGICAKIIQEYGNRVGKEPYTLVVDDKVLNKKVSDIYRKQMGEFPTESDIKSIRSLISYIKNSMLTEEEKKALNEKEGFPIYEIFTEYNGELKKEGLMDYDDQMLYAYVMLQKTPDFLEQYRRIYPYICVDEAQDTSKIQHEIIKLLAGEGGNLFMVGDEDQSIYGFRAAYPKALLEFESSHPGAQVLLMEQNYRSEKEIVRVANEFIQKNKFRHKKKMISSKNSGALEDETSGGLSVEKKEKEIEFLSLKSRKGQYSVLCKMAMEAQEQTAILYRENESAIPLIDLLERQGIGYRLRNADFSFFTNRVVLDILRILQFGFDQKNEEIFLQIYYKLQTFLKKEQAFKICEIAKEKGISILQAVEYEDSISSMVNGKCRAIRTHYLNMRPESPYRAIQRIVKFMGYGEYLERNKLSDGKIQILELLAKEEDNIEGFLARIEKLQEIIQNGERDWKSKVILSTIHSSKGLEYDRVYLLDVCDGVFPEKVIKNYKQAEEESVRNYEEERRLFYVGMTRAKHSLKVFQIENEKSSFLEEMKEYAYSLPGENKGLQSKNSAQNKNLPQNKYFLKNKKGLGQGAANIYRVGELKPSPSEYSAPEIHVGDLVLQQKYGAGVIVKITQKDDGTPDLFEVENDTFGIKKYKYPIAFQSGMKLLQS